MRTILAVDNDAAALEQLCGHLAALFPRDTILPFAHSMPAMKYLHQHPRGVHCLFAALLLRQMDGLQLMVHLHKTCPGAVAYLLTETDSWELRTLAWSYGARDTLQKPLTLDQLQSATKELSCEYASP